MDKKTIAPKLESPLILLQKAWEAYFPRFSLYTQILLFPTIFVIFLESISYLGNYTGNQNIFTLVAHFITERWLIYLLLMLAMLVMQSAATAALLTAITSEKTLNVKEAYEAGLKKLLSLWWVGLLSSLVIMGGFLLLVIPGILFMVWFSLSQYVLIAENKKGAEALNLSREYIRGFFVPVTFRLAVIILVTSVLSGLGSLLFLQLPYPFLKTLIQELLQLILVPFAMLYTYLLYQNLRVVRGQLNPVMTTARKFWLLIPGIVLPILILIGMGFAAFYLKPFRITGNAMSPAFYNGEDYLISQFPMPPELVIMRGNAVVFKNKEQTQIGRIKAMPGDIISRSKGMLNLNTSQNKQNESLLASIMRPAFPLPENETKKLGQNEILIMFDNLATGKPNWELINPSQIVGQPLFCYLNCREKESFTTR